MSRSRDLSKIIANNSICPPGVIFPYVSNTAPAGWLTCDGSAVSRSTYSALFVVIGTTYGGGDGSTTFNLPNFVNRVPVGHGTKTLGATGGNSSVTPSGSVDNTTLSSSQIPSHSHRINVSGADDNNHTGNGDAVADSDAGLKGYLRNTEGTGGGGAHNHGLSMSSISVEQPWTAVNYIIKT